MRRTNPGTRPGATGTLRIIGGRWRGRKLSFPAIPGLRPTPDRVRETLFNWLQPYLAGARCLDLFAGSGALGFEALSRGAAEVWLVDRDRRAVQAWQDNATRVQATGMHAVLSDVQALWRTDHGQFDILFLDPPYHQGWIGPCCHALEQGSWLAPGARVYLEAEHGLNPLPLPPGWEVLKSRQAGQVGYHLVGAPTRDPDL